MDNWIVKIHFSEQALLFQKSTFLLNDVGTHKKRFAEVLLIRTYKMFSGFNSHLKIKYTNNCSRTSKLELPTVWMGQIQQVGYGISTALDEW